MRRIAVQPASLEKLSSLLTETRTDRLTASAQWARSLLAGRGVWNINATAHGGGVAEMLQTLLAYARGAGVDTRWLVLDADAAFFSITKRIHNALHGVLAAGSDFGAAQHEHYARVLQRNLANLREVVRPGDIVLLHDPPTAGLVGGIRGLGAQVVWHVTSAVTSPIPQPIKAGNSFVDTSSSLMRWCSLGSSTCRNGCRASGSE